MLSRRSSRIIAGLALAACLLATAAAAGEGARRFLVATANPHASRAAAEVIRLGGSAVDAAIAAQLVLTLVEPQSSGIGGGAFMLHFDAETGNVTAYDGRETAPAAATPDMFLDGDGEPLGFYEAAVGGLAVGVPGVLRMLALAHGEHGRLPWARDFEPAIVLSSVGFPVSPRLHALIAADGHLGRFEAARAYFHDAAGDPLAVGHKLINRALAATLRAVAVRGVRAFYEGDIARDIVAAVAGAEGNPGRMSMADLALYEAKARSPVCAPYRAWRVCGMPPPSSGGITTLQILGILSKFELSALEPNSAAAVHLVAQASRLAYADRNAYIGDSDFVAVPTAEMLDPAYLATRAALVSEDRDMGPAAPGVFGDRAQAPPADGAAEGASTTHFVIVDPWGDVVTMTSSIESAFGSRLLVRGFLLNNQLTDFAFRPTRDGRAVANRPGPGKRPRSSMAPTLVFAGDGRLSLAVGSPGGARIIPYVVKAVLGVLDWGLDIEGAIALPNHTNLNGVTTLEEGTALKAIAAELEAMGHEVVVRKLTSGLHGIALTPDGLFGGADPRREGLVHGE